MMTERKLQILIVAMGLFLCILGKPLIVNADDYVYDDNGRVISVTHDDGSCTEYEYDENGNIISVKKSTNTQGKQSSESSDDQKNDNENQNNVSNDIDNVSNTVNESAVNTSTINQSEVNISTINQVESSVDSDEIRKDELDKKADIEERPKDNILENNKESKKDNKESEKDNIESRVSTGDNSYIFSASILMLISLIAGLVIVHKKKQHEVTK